MKVLKFSQKYMAFLGISSLQLHEPTNEFLYSPGAYIILFGLLQLVAAAFVYIINHITDLDTTTNSYIVISACAATAASFASMGASMKTTKSFHIELQKMINKGKIVTNFFIRIEKLNLTYVFIFF